MNSLIIGNTAQLSYYFPQEYERISSRDVDFDFYKDKFYDRIFFCFGENRTYIEEATDMFVKTNVYYTLDLLRFFADKCNKLVIYGTSELWNNCEGPITIKTIPKFNKSPYIDSKAILTIAIHQMQLETFTYKNVIILHPFNFNSFHRKGQFLFGKIFDSILNKKHIEIGDTYFYRDMVHPKHVAERSILAKEDEIVGSGRLTFVNDFIRDLYNSFDMKYEDYVLENMNNNLKIKRGIYYLQSQEHLYSSLLEDTLTDILKNK
jgi:nucleoside-diphosphate-sugar epimerase